MKLFFVTLLQFGHAQAILVGSTRLQLHLKLLRGDFFPTPRIFIIINLGVVALQLIFAGTILVEELREFARRHGCGHAGEVKRFGESLTLKRLYIAIFWNFMAIF